MAVTRTAARGAGGGASKFLSASAAGIDRSPAPIGAVGPVCHRDQPAALTQSLLGAPPPVQNRGFKIPIRSQGARSGQVVRLLLFDFLKPVLAANLIAWPFIYFAAARYLDAFSVRIALTPVPFLLALATTIAVAVLAVGGRVLYAASIKPAKALRHE
jgi:hypothetical protein